MKHTLLITLGFTLFLNSCELDNTKPKTEPTSNEPYALNVLNDNSGFQTFYDSAYSISKNSGGGSGTIGLNDFSIEINNRINMNYYTTTPTQQSTLNKQYRFSINLNNNQFIEQEANAGQYPLNPNIFYDKVVHQYLPYSNILGIIATKYSSGFGSNNGIEYFGDVTGGISSPNPIGIGDFGFRYAVSNSGTGFGYFSFSNPTVVKSGAQYVMFKGAIGKQSNLDLYRGGCLHEVYSGNTISEFYTIGLKSDSVIVYKFEYTDFGVGGNPIYTTKQINALPTSILNTGSLKRHYSVDGKIMAFMFTDLSTNKVNTYVYNFSTNTLTQNLNQVTLEYASTGSDIDIDENGNVYYTGYASNGSNMNGVSVYKKSNSSSAELVGNDNILKSGTVVGLKHYFGKVYLAVTANQVGGNVHQISFIKQN